MTRWFSSVYFPPSDAKARDAKNIAISLKRISSCEAFARIMPRIVIADIVAAYLVFHPERIQPLKTI